ncbi:hypothetical protein [Proteiniclasticum ruminis]|uniref:hypothetical protein n=1 Tax=Proteiniclasticum ruminis TaxID=398199 RepID=UPI0028AC8C4E|nr:hypothetical protein [Proteiniclasticum ruminis]
MKKLLFFSVAAITMFIVVGCNQQTLESKLRDEIKEMGYEIIEYEDEVFPFEIRSKEEEYKDISRAIFWEIQEFDISNYEGKTIDYHIFRVAGHPIEKSVNNAESTEIRLGVIDDVIVGGFSSPYKKGETYLGGPATIDGRSLEQLTDMTYIEWFNSWRDKYE